MFGFISGTKLRIFSKIKFFLTNMLVFPYYVNRGINGTRPYSAGCQISHLADFNEVTSILKDIGFKYGEGKDAWVKGDNIKIVIKAPPIVEN